MMTGFERYTKKTRRAIFLEEMEQVVPWARLCALIEPHYRKAGNGRRPVGLERMLRIYFLQQWFNLADPAVEEALYDSATLRQFAGIDLGAEPVPDETTVCKFRQLLEEHNLGEEILGTVSLHLQAKGVRITTGTIVDATIIHAPSSTKNRDQSRDPEMHQARKGKQWYFGMKAHVVRSGHKTCLRNILQNRFADLSQLLRVGSVILRHDRYLGHSLCGGIFLTGRKHDKAPHGVVLYRFHLRLCARRCALEPPIVFRCSEYL